MGMPTAPVKVLGITQERRGHGISTAAFFLARTLTQQHVPVLLADLTERHARLRELEQEYHTPNLVLWSPPPVALRDMPGLLNAARSRVTGKARLIILDGDLATIERLSHLPPRTGMDYLIIATEPTTDGQRSAQRIADRFTPLREQERIGVAFARVGAKESDELPEQTEGHLPVMGHWPADYRLATTEDYSASGPLPSEPHEPYNRAVMRMATLVVRVLGLNR